MHFSTSIARRFVFSSKVSTASTSCKPSRTFGTNCVARSPATRSAAFQQIQHSPHDIFAPTDAGVRAELIERWNEHVAEVSTHQIFKILRRGMRDFFAHGAHVVDVILQRAEYVRKHSRHLIIATDINNRST
jgi:hypothetical protein